MINKIKNSIIGRIKYLLLNFNEIGTNSKIEKSNKIKGTTIQGKFIIGKENNLSNSELFGKINIGNNNLIEHSRVKGEIFIGNNCKLYYCRIAGNVAIGKNTSLWGPNLDINSTPDFPVKIGNYCSIAKNISLQTYNHNHKKITSYFMGKNFFNENWKNEIVSKGGVDIKNDVWIGSHCVILGGITIGNGSIVAANSLVNKDVPNYAIVAGSPAKIIGFRFDETEIEKLLQLKWWDWSDEKLKLNKFLFENEVQKIDLDLIK